MNNMPAPRWRRSSHSDHSGGNCVEVADLGSTVGVRDSKDPDGTRLIMNHDDFRYLAEAIKNR